MGDRPTRLTRPCERIVSARGVAEAAPLAWDRVGQWPISWWPGVMRPLS